MRLAAKLMQQIVGRPVDRFAGSGQKRALGRVEIQNPATVFSLRDDVLGNPISVTLRDISAETIGLTSDRAFMPSSSIIISIPLSDSENLAIRCRVTRCTRAWGGRFVMAAHFVSLADPNIVQANLRAGN